MKSITYTPTTRKVPEGYLSLVLAYRWTPAGFLRGCEICGQAGPWPNRSVAMRQAKRLKELCKEG